SLCLAGSRTELKRDSIWNLIILNPHRSGSKDLGLGEVVCPRWICTDNEIVAPEVVECAVPIAKNLNLKRRHPLESVVHFDLCTRLIRFNKYLVCDGTIRPSLCSWFVGGRTST